MCNPHGDRYDNPGSRVRSGAFYRRLLIGLCVVALTVPGLGLNPAALAGSQSQSQIWVGTWATSPQPPALFFPTPATFEDQTLRQIVRTSVGGDAVRVRLSNSLGDQALTIDAASIGIHDQGGYIMPGTLRALSFGGDPSITIPAGARVLSDPVDLTVDAEQDLAISVYVAEESEASTLHADADQTSYVSLPGDFTDVESWPGGDTTTSWFWLTGIDVVAHRTTQVVVATGDSITDGFASTVDANARWPDELSRRLNERRRGAQKAAVLNAGISGNRILTSFIGPNALARLDRDVLTQTGVTHVILLEGINDIGIPVIFDPSEEVTAEEIIAGMKQVIARARARGLKIYGGTLLPYKGAGYYTADGEVKRQAVNDFIRNAGAFDAYIDFDQALRDPDDPLRLLPLYDSGDHLHPSDAGYKRMGEIIDLDLFKLR